MSLSRWTWPSTCSPVQAAGGGTPHRINDACTRAPLRIGERLGSEELAFGEVIDAQLPADRSMRSSCLAQSMQFFVAAAATLRLRRLVLINSHGGTEGCGCLLLSSVLSPKKPDRYDHDGHQRLQPVSLPRIWGLGKHASEQLALLVGHRPRRLASQNSGYSGGGLPVDFPLRGVGCQLAAQREGLGPITSVSVPPDLICSHVTTGLSRGWPLRTAD
jgi:hypothetical protein